MTDWLVGTADFTPAEWERESSGGYTPEAFRANAQATLEALQLFRDAVGVPILITDAWRSPADNARTPGASPTSDHMTARGVDFDVPSLSKRQVAARLDAADAAGQLGDYGQLIYYLTDNHYHLGTGTRQEKLVKVDASRYVPYTGVDSLPGSAAPADAESSALVAFAIIGLVTAGLLLRNH